MSTLIFLIQWSFKKETHFQKNPDNFCIKNDLENENLAIFVTSAFLHFKIFLQFALKLVTFLQKWS